MVLIAHILGAMNLFGQVQVAVLATMSLLLALAVMAWRRRGGSALPSLGDVALPPTSDGAPAAGEARSAAIAREGDTNPWSDAIRRLEAKRNSHVVGFIHYLSARDSRHQGIVNPHLQDFLWSLRDVAPEAPLDIILHSLGGDPSSIQQIARAIKAHKGPTTVFVPYYAHGLTALIALAADQIVMSHQAAFSFPQPTDADVETLVRDKGMRSVEDGTLINLHIERNWWRELKTFVEEIVKPDAKAFAGYLFDSARSISMPIGSSDASIHGLAVSTNMPSEISEIIEACQCFPNNTVEVKLGHQNGVRNAENTGAQNAESETAYGWCEPSCHAGVAPLLRAMQQRRGSSVICVVHGPSMVSNYVDMATAKDVLRALSMVDATAPLDIILHTPGGLSFHGQQIASAIKAHRGRKTVFVPYFAWSAGTLIALAADEIVMSDYAALGPIDSQYHEVPASAWVSVLKLKPHKKIGDNTLICGQVCERLIKDDHHKAVGLMKSVYSPSVANRIVHTLNDGTLTHGYPITFQAAQKLGLKVTNAMPPEPEQIVHEFRDPDLGYRSVIFCSSR